MIQLILFLLIGALLFLSLIFLVWRSPRAEKGSAALVEARQALVALQTGLLPMELIGRIFAREDLEYVRSQAPAPVCAMFLSERKVIALAWAAQIRKQVLNLMRFHLGSARFYARLTFRTELALALQFAGLLLACRALQIVLYVGGPYAAPRIVGATVATAAQVCSISEQSLAFLNSAQLGVLPVRPRGASL
ncbi:MAG TPA: hypothetical protein VGR97_07155 [Candidatus Acidoferrales bacterium]|nr:hypothetical protein [Candidatus Acidoferrales bacterium]